MIDWQPIETAPTRSLEEVLVWHACGHGNIVAGIDIADDAGYTHWAPINPPARARMTA